MAGTSKTIPPGNWEAKILQLEITERKYRTNDDKPIFDLVLHMESKPIGGNFQGFRKDMNDESKGYFLGQVARVKYNEWGFSDAVLKGGTELFAEKEISKALKSLCMEISQLQWFQQQDDSLPTAKELVERINKAELFKDHYLFWCFGSKQYVNKKGYATDDLYLPKYSAEAGKPFSKKFEGTIIYNSTIHFMKPKGAATATAASSNTAQTKMEMPEKVESGDDNLGKSDLFIPDDDDLPF